MQPEYLAEMLEIKQYEILSRRLIGLRVSIAELDKRHRPRNSYLKGLRAMRTSIDNAIAEIERDGTQMQLESPWEHAERKGYSY